MDKFLSKIKRRTLIGYVATISAIGLILPICAESLMAAKQGGTLRVSVNRAASKLNPLLHRLSSEYLLGELLYSGLTRLGEGMEIIPDLAESWTANKNLDEWTFKLRDGVKFHNGNKLTPKDVVTSLTAILDKKTGSPGRRNLGPIVSVTAGTNNTVIVKTKVGYGDLPSALAYPTAKIVPAEIVTNDFKRLSREAIGTGPFKLVSFEPDRLVVVERNPNYFIPKYPYLDKVEVHLFPDSSAEMASLIAGEMDLAMGIPPADFKRISSTNGIIGLRTPSGRFIDVVMANDRKPFNDQRIREALSLTLDREVMIDMVADGYGTPGNDSPINSAYQYYAAAPQKKANISKAKQLLAQAGYPNGIDLTMVASVKPGYRKTLAVTIREMARSAGFNIKVETMSHATYLKQVWKKGDFYVGFYNMQPTEDALFKLLLTSDAAWNETRWNNREFDNLVEMARTTTDTTKRRKLYASAQKLMQKELPILVPVFFDLLSAHRSYVQDYKLHPRGATFKLERVSLGAGAPQR